MKKLSTGVATSRVFTHAPPLPPAVIEPEGAWTVAREPEIDMRLAFETLLPTDQPTGEGRLQSFHVADPVALMTTLSTG